MPCKYRKLIKKLRKHCVDVDPSSGKGRHRMLFDTKGEHEPYPIPFHGNNVDIEDSVIKAICRNFDIESL